MRYDQIIKQIAKNEKTTEEAVKKEMEKAQIGRASCRERV